MLPDRCGELSRSPLCLCSLVAMTSTSCPLVSALKSQRQAIRRRKKHQHGKWRADSFTGLTRLLFNLIVMGCLQCTNEEETPRQRHPHLKSCCIGKQSLCCISQASNCLSSHRDRIISPSFMILLKKTEWWDGRGRECEVCQCHPTTTQTRRTLDILT